MPEGVILGIDGKHLASSMRDIAGHHMGGEISSWSVTGKSVDEMYLPIKEEADAKAADIICSNSTASGAVQTYVDSVVGHQFRLNAKPNYRRLGISADDARSLAKDIEAAFTEYAEDPRCFIDAERRLTFTGLIRAGVRSHMESGEIFSSAEWFSKQGSNFNTSIKRINPGRISNPNNIMDTDKLRAGMELNSRGASVAVHLRSNQYCPYGLHSLSGNWRRIPMYKAWGREQILHVFEPFGDGNCRGTTAFINVLGSLKTLERYKGVRLQNAVINAMYAATIESEMDPQTIFQVLGGDESGAKSLVNYMEAVGEYHKGANIRMNGAKIAHLFPNEKLKLNAPANVDNGFADFERSILRHIAAGLNLSYEQLAKDYSQVNYSSARAALMNEWRFFMGRRAMIASRYATKIYWLWLEEAINRNIIKLPSKAKFNFYEATSAWGRASWIGAGRLSIDGIKEIKEAILKIEAGLSTYEKELANLGEDYQEIFEQQVREMKERDSEGLPRAIWAKAENFAPGDSNSEGKNGASAGNNQQAAGAGS